MNEDTPTAGNNQMIDSTVAIVAAALSNSQHPVTAELMTGLITSAYQTLVGLGVEGAASPVEEKIEPFCSARASIKPDYLVCLFDGKRMKMLKRYIANQYNLTPDQYRAKFGLAADYPMVAPNYSEKRRKLAQAIGLGHSGRGGGRKAAVTDATDTTAKKRGRPAAKVEAEPVTA